ncbi:hypothetical protein Tco_1323473 [Tanacetum coccineum]
MTPESVQAMIDQALLRNSTNGDGSHSSHGDNRRNVQTTRPCFYADFMKCQPLNFKGNEGVVGLTRWIEKMESVFNISGCAIENQVKFATCTLLGAALTWWNETRNRVVEPKGQRERCSNIYSERFQELTLICTKFVANETEKVDKYISGLPDNIYGSVKSSRPKTLDETFELANELMDQKLRTYAERQTENKRKADDSSKNNHGHQQQPFKRQNVANVYNMGAGEKNPYGGSLPKDTLQLADATGITMLPNDEIFEGMGQMGYPTDGTFTFWKSFFTPQWRYLVHHLLHCISSKSGGWDQFGSNIATALICLSTGRVYNFSKLIFDGMVANLKSKTKFLMYPRFLQMILNIQTENKHLYLAVSLTKKIFGNMKRGFRGAPRPLLPAMLLVASTNPNAGQEHDAVTQSQPSSSTPPVPSTSSPPVQSPPPIPASIPTPTPTPIPETEPAPFEHTFEEPSPVHQHFSPPQEQAQGQMTMDDLLQVVPQLISRIDSLETDLKQTKLTMGNAIVKLVKKVKKLEGFLKRRNMVLSDSEEEEPEAQGRKSQDDPLASLVQGLVTPSTTKVNASGEEQVEDISPNTLEAAKTLSRVASLKPKSIDKGRRYKRRKETKGKKVVSSLVFQEEVDTGAKEVNTAEGVNTGSIKISTVSEQVSTGSTKKTTPSPDKGQRAGKAPMIIEETPKDTLQKEEVAKQVHLDSLLAQGIVEEEELNEQQKKRKAQVQFEAQHYTDEDWDLIRAKIEANAELSKSMLGSDLQGEDFAKKMVDLVNQRKKYFAEVRARAKRNKPMTQSQLKTYMMNYLKNQGTWKLSQLKNLSFEEVKEEFDKLVKQVESFAPINFEATKASLKRFGEELPTKTTKRLKDDEAKDVEPAKKSGKRRKQMTRKGLLISA